MENKEAQRLIDLLFAGSISSKDKKRLISHFRSEWGIPGLKDQQIAEILITGHDDYGKPDKKGELKII